MPGHREMVLRGRCGVEKEGHLSGERSWKVSRTHTSFLPRAIPGSGPQLDYLKLLPLKVLFPEAFIVKPKAGVSRL